MRQYHRKISKCYQKFNFEIEDGLSTYDLQLLSLSNKSKKKQPFITNRLDELLAA